MINLNKKIISLIKDSSFPLLICHANPDGDALGSICAFINYFEKIGKKYQAFCFGKISSTFKFLTGIEKICQDQKYLNFKNHDLIIVLDCGDLKQTGVEEQFKNFLKQREFETFNPTIINIDHHVTNEYFGDINLVAKKASSTSEIIFVYFKDFFDIDVNIATSLFLGIFTDTSNFSNPATTTVSFQTAASLLAQGAKVQVIKENILKNKTLNHLKAWGKAMENLIENKKFGIAVTLVSSNDFDNYLNEELLEGFTNFLNNLSGVKAVLVLREKEGEIKGSLRTTCDSIDVSRLARLFGGGGHQRAAGFTIRGKLVKVKDGWKVE
jgi:phosphoesterase RecJ-like protein